MTRRLAVETLLVERAAGEHERLLTVTEEKCRGHLSNNAASHMLEKLGMNQHGLSRNIPEEVCRALRQEAGFGCLICGYPIGEYEHIDPEYKDAKRHDPERMAFLCSQCHGNLTRGQWSKAKVWEAKRTPKAFAQDFSFGEFDIGPDWPAITLGNFELRRCRDLIVVDGTPILSIRPPHTEGGPFRISARLVDTNGVERLVIEDNAWRPGLENWDVVARGGRIVFREAKGDIRISIRTQDRSLIFERLHLEANGHSFLFDDDGFRIESAWGERFMMGAAKLEGCAGAIGIDGPALAIGWGRDGAKCNIGRTSINANIQTQDQMRAVFQRKVERYGLRSMMDPTMGGTPLPFKDPLIVIR